MARTTTHHRCTECGGIDYWHYTLSPSGEPLFAREPGTQCWGPGQPSYEPKHVLAPDFSQPFTEADLPQFPIGAA